MRMRIKYKYGNDHSKFSTHYYHTRPAFPKTLQEVLALSRVVLSKGNSHVVQWAAIVNHDDNDKIIMLLIDRPNNFHRLGHTKDKETS